MVQEPGSGMWRVWPANRRERVSRTQGPGSLAVTRSLGHPEFSKHGVISDPEMSCLELHSSGLEYSIALLTTDGVTDALSCAKLAEVVGKHAADALQGIDVSELAQEIVGCANRAPEPDDATVVVIAVQNSE